jgi:hypothetical protein
VKPTWCIIGASVQGTSHQKNDIPCQDAHGYRVLPGGTALFAVADGAGSAKRSGEGARCAVTTALDALQVALAEELPQDEIGWEALLTGVFRQARQTVVQLAKAENVSLRAFATTLTIAAASEDRLVAGQIGDGVMVAKGEAGRLFAATQPQHGEYANETFFLTMAGSLQRLQVWVYPHAVHALAVMTDGLIRLALKVATNETVGLSGFGPSLRSH